ncbi:MAG: hypothetical protein ACYC56_11975, partial [Candidatus Aquicultor sp.]
PAKELFPPQEDRFKLALQIIRRRIDILTRSEEVTVDTVAEEVRRLLSKYKRKRRLGRSEPRALRTKNTKYPFLKGNRYPCLLS